MRPTSQIEVDLGHIANNLRTIRELVGDGCGVCPVVKANAYGLGARRVARTLTAEGAAMLAVYSMQQAAELLGAAPAAPLLVLMPVDALERTDETYRGLVAGRMHLTVHDREHLALLRQQAALLGVVVPVHLEIDTGMRRGGCRPEEAAALIEAIRQDRRLRLSGIFTHFAGAETDPAGTLAQADTFDAVLSSSAVEPGSDCIVHLANTVATLRDARLHRTMVRVGQGWAGYGQEWLRPGEELASDVLLHPAVRWLSQVVQVKDVAAGESVGYGGAWTAERPSRVALVPVGYADGYPQSLGTRAEQPPAQVGVRTRDGELAFAPVVGAISMDQVTIDVTDLAVDRGAEVELIGNDRAAPNHLPRLAAICGSSPYELLCRLRESIPRKYLAPTRAGDISIETVGKIDATSVSPVVSAG